MAGVWWVLELTLPREGAEALGDLLLAEGALSVTLEDAAAETEAEHPILQGALEPYPLWPHVVLRAIFPKGSDPAGRLREVSKRLGWTQLPPWRIESLTEADWVRQGLEGLEPILVEGRLWVVPSWKTPPTGDLPMILLDPGAAFGTGTHPTTNLCLRRLVHRIGGGERVLDYGCGSGILALAAARLGASCVTAVDIDPDALAATRENARKNGISLAVIHPDHLPAIQVDLLVANILAPPLITLAPRLTSLVAPGGTILLSGILREQQAGVVAAYAEAFEWEPPIAMEEWVALTGRRKETS